MFAGKNLNVAGEESDEEGDRHLKVRTELVGFLGPLTFSFKLWLAGGRGRLQCCV